MKKLNFSKLEKFEDAKVAMDNIRGGETVGTGNGVYANGSVHAEFCTAFPDGSWHIWFD